MRYSRALLSASVLALCVGCDHATKLAATACNVADVAVIAGVLWLARRLFF